MEADDKFARGDHAIIWNPALERQEAIARRAAVIAQFDQNDAIPSV